MTRSEYAKRLLQALDEGRINTETYDAMILNADFFYDEEDDDDNSLEEVAKEDDDDR